jgi:hypothetical protein
MSRVWWSSYHPTVKSCSVLVYSALLYKCCCRCCLSWWDSTGPGAGIGGWRRVMASWMTSCDVCRLEFIIPLFSNSELRFVIFNPSGQIRFKLCFVLWTRLRVSFNSYVRSSVWFPSDSVGFDPTTNDGMVYCCLMAKVDWFRRVFSWAGCHNTQCTDIKAGKKIDTQKQND